MKCPKCNGEDFYQCMVNGDTCMDCGWSARKEAREEEVEPEVVEEVFGWAECEGRWEM